jgi:hypothetical protein
LINPLASIAATKQVHLGDVVVTELDEHSQKLVFFRDDTEAVRAAAAADAVRALDERGDHGRIAA